MSKVGVNLHIFNNDFEQSPVSSLPKTKENIDFISKFQTLSARIDNESKKYAQSQESSDVNESGAYSGTYSDKSSVSTSGEEQKVKSLESERGSIESSADKEIASLEEQIQSMVSNSGVKEKLISQHTKAKSDLASCESNIRQTSSQISNCNRKISSIGVEIASYQGQLNSFCTNTGDPDLDAKNAAKIESIKAKISNLQSQKAAVEAQRQGFEVEKSSLEAEKSTLQQNVATIQQQISSKSKTPDLASKISQLESQIEQCKSKRDSDLSQKDSEIQEAQKALTEKQVQERNSLEVNRDKTENIEDSKVTSAENDLFSYLDENSAEYGELSSLIKEYNSLQDELNEKVDEPTNKDYARMNEIEREMLQLENSDNPEDKARLAELKKEHSGIDSKFDDFKGEYYIERFGDKKGDGIGIGDKIAETQEKINDIIESTDDEELKQELIEYNNAIENRATSLAQIDADIAVKTQEIIDNKDIKIDEKVKKALVVGFKQLNLGVTEDGSKDNSSTSNNYYLEHAGYSEGNTAWCASFASYLYADGQGEDNSDTFGKTIRVKNDGKDFQSLRTIADKAGFYSKIEENESELGDIFIMNRNDSSHTGIVVGEDYTGAVETIEGNAQNAVRKLTYIPGSDGYEKIDGYIKQNDWLEQAEKYHQI